MIRLSLLIFFVSLARRRRSLIVFWIFLYHDIDNICWISKMFVRAIKFDMFFFMTFITFHLIWKSLVVELTRSLVARSRIEFIMMIFSIELLKLTRLILFKRQWLNSIDKVFKLFEIVLIIIAWMFFTFVRTIHHSFVAFQRLLLYYNFD